MFDSNSDWKCCGLAIDIGEVSYTIHTKTI